MLFAILSADCNIVDGENGVHLTYTKDGRPSGEAFLELHTDEDMQKYDCLFCCCFACLILSCMKIF